jgi:FkbM family methyltransferase
MKRILTVAGGLAVIAAAAWFYMPSRVRLLVWSGRGIPCQATDAARGIANRDQQVALKDRILKASRLAQQDPAGFNQWQTPSGPFWLPKGSDYALPWDLAEQERNIYGTGERSVRAGDIVLDCGANIGVYTRVALAAGAKTVVAIEIAPENLECLRRNFAEEVKAGRVIIYPKGVWDKDDVITLTVDPKNSAADTVVMTPENAQSGPRVPLTTIDKIVAELKLERVDYIKMDIEGAEQNALKGGRETMAKFHPRMALSAYHRPDDPAKIPGLVSAAWSGYRFECGSCAMDGAAVRPEVIFAY